MLRKCQPLFLGHFPRYQHRHPATQVQMQMTGQRGNFKYQTGDLGAWGQKNDKLYYPARSDPISGEPEFIRPAEIYHGRVRTRISHKNMAHAAWYVKNLNVDEAIQKCKLGKRKCLLIVADVLREAKDKAAKFDVEWNDFLNPSNMHVAASWSEMDMLERHMRWQGPYVNQFRTRYTNYYVMLREGPPPEPNYSERTAQRVGEDFIKMMTEREIIYGL